MTILMRDPNNHTHILSSEMNLTGSLLSFWRMYESEIPHLENLVNYIQWRINQSPPDKEKFLGEFKLTESISGKQWVFRVSYLTLGLIKT